MICESLADRRRRSPSAERVGQCQAVSSALGCDLNIERDGQTVSDQKALRAHTSLQVWGGNEQAPLGFRLCSKWLFGNVKGSFPEGLTFPNKTSAIALPACCPGMKFVTTAWPGGSRFPSQAKKCLFPLVQAAATSWDHGNSTAPGVVTTTTCKERCK